MSPTDKATPTASAAPLTDADRLALRKLAELRLPVWAYFVQECPARYAALENRGLVAQPTPGKWAITDAGRVALS